jgi:hypothetical protein
MYVAINNFIALLIFKFICVVPYSISIEYICFCSLFLWGFTHVGVCKSGSLECIVLVFHHVIMSCVIGY